MMGNVVRTSPPATDDEYDSSDDIGWCNQCGGWGQFMARCSCGEMLMYEPPPSDDSE